MNPQEKAILIGMEEKQAEFSFPAQVLRSTEEEG